MGESYAGELVIMQVEDAQVWKVIEGKGEFTQLVT